MRAAAPERNPVEWECCRMLAKTAASGIISLRTGLYNPSVTLYRVERSLSEFDLVVFRPASAESALLLPRMLGEIFFENATKRCQKCM